MPNRHVKFGRKIPKRLGKNASKPQRGGFCLTHIVQLFAPQIFLFYILANCCLLWNVDVHISHKFSADDN